MSHPQWCGETIIDLQSTMKRIAMNMFQDEAFHCIAGMRFLVEAHLKTPDYLFLQTSFCATCAEFTCGHRAAMVSEGCRIWLFNL